MIFCFGPDERGTARWRSHRACMRDRLCEPDQRIHVAEARQIQGAVNALIGIVVKQTPTRSERMCRQRLRAITTAFCARQATGDRAGGEPAEAESPSLVLRAASRHTRCRGSPDRAHPSEHRWPTARRPAPSARRRDGVRKCCSSDFGRNDVPPPRPRRSRLRAAAGRDAQSRGGGPSRLTPASTGA